MKIVLHLCHQTRHPYRLVKNNKITKILIAYNFYQMHVFNYFMQVSLLMGLFYLLYWSLLKKETFFLWNRVYLLVTPLLALVIPLLPMPDVFTQAVQQTPMHSNYVEHFVISQGSTEEAISSSPAFSWGFIIGGLYLLGVVYFTFCFLKSLFFILRLVKRFGSEKQPGYKLVQADVEDLPIFSFWNLVFWNKNTLVNKERHKQILQHEIAHVRQRHTLDILYLEILGIVFWFNPVCVFYKRSMKNIHEYLADNSLISTGVDKKEYCELLVNELLNANQV